MRLWVVSALLAGSILGQEARPAREVKAVVTLEDGSRFTARVADQVLTVKTEYGDPKIPLRAIASIRRSGDRFRVSTATLNLEGTLSAEAFDFETGLGALHVGVKSLRSLEIGWGLSPFVDDRTIALWAFDEVRGGTCFDRVQRRELNITDGVFVSKGDGPAVFVRKSENSYAECDLGKDFQGFDGPFTIEARFKVGPITKKYAMILARHVPGNKQIRQFFLLAIDTGAININSSDQQGGSFVSQTPNDLCDLKSWTYLALVCDTKGGQIDYFVNGKRVFTDRQPPAFKPCDGPLYVGPGPEAVETSCPERIQFVRLSKGTRSPEEIADWEKALEAGEPIGSKGEGRGIVLRDGSFIRAEFPTLAESKFKTKYGTLTLTGKTPGRLSLHRYREKELAKMDEEVKDLIDRLGSGAPEERDEAEQRLGKIGAPALARLKEHREDSDEEIRARVLRLLKSFEESGAASEPVADLLIMGSTTISGWLDADTIRVASPYGAFSVAVKGVASLLLGDAAPAATRVLRLKTGERIEGEPPKGQDLEIDTEFGSLKFPMSDVETLAYDAEKKAWVVKTSRVAAIGKVAGEHLEWVTPAGTIRVPLADIVDLGPARPAASGKK